MGAPGFAGIGTESGPRRLGAVVSRRGCCRRWFSTPTFETMDSTLTNLRAWQVWKGLKHLSVSAACEDSATAERVDEFCRGLARDLGRCEVTEEKWRLSELRLPQLRSIAADEAAQASLVIVSVHHAESLPVEMKGWIELWLRSKHPHPIALLALFDPAYQGNSNAIAAYLNDIARRANMEFVSKSEETPDER